MRVAEPSCIYIHLTDRNRNKQGHLISSFSFQLLSSPGRTESPFGCIFMLLFTSVSMHFWFMDNCRFLKGQKVLMNIQINVLNICHINKSVMYHRAFKRLLGLLLNTRNDRLRIRARPFLNPVLVTCCTYIWKNTHFSLSSNQEYCYFGIY